ncbi:hypothetical protein P4233_11200 [Pseudomonas aeruginosa]|nr:hypothetical protein [Pseudomonas aeruginosa]
MTRSAAQVPATPGRTVIDALRLAFRQADGEWPSSIVRCANRNCSGTSSAQSFDECAELFAEGPAASTSNRPLLRARW